MEEKNSIMKIIAISVILIFLMSGFTAMAKGEINTDSSSTQTNPVISNVNFQNNGGSYTITITGTNFGSLGGLPFTGDTSYFRIADAAQLGFGEWGYSGDAKTLTYESWSNTNIVVSGFQGNPGDAIIIALWNPQTGLGATWGGNVPTAPSTYPVITSVQFSGSGQSLEIIVNGNNFGPSPVQMPYSGDLNYFAFGDFRTHGPSGSSLFAAGCTGWGLFGSGDSVTLNYTSWTNTQIIISGFGGTYGQNGATVQYGDPVSINIWATTDSSYTGPQTAWGGFINAVNYNIVFTETGLPSGTLWALTLNGKTYASTTNTITAQVPNGQYYFYLQPVSGFSASPTSGMIIVSGNNVYKNIRFMPNEATYTITFTEYGLPQGTLWSINLNGNTLSSTTNTISFTDPNGTYSYSIELINGYTVTSSSGTISVNGANLNIEVEFYPSNYYNISMNIIFKNSPYLINISVNGTALEKLLSVSSLPNELSNVEISNYLYNFLTNPTIYNVYSIKVYQNKYSINNINNEESIFYDLLVWSLVYQNYNLLINTYNLQSASYLSLSTLEQAQCVQQAGIDLSDFLNYATIIGPIIGTIGSYFSDASGPTAQAELFAHIIFDLIKGSITLESDYGSQKANSILNTLTQYGLISSSDPSSYNSAELITNLAQMSPSNFESLVSFIYTDMGIQSNQI